MDNISKQKREPLVVTYNNPPKRQKKDSVQPPQTQVTKSGNTTSTSSKPNFDFKKARWEVRKYGIQSLSGSSKEEAMTNLLIRLGAKAPKKEYVNYKLLQQKIKATQQTNAARNEEEETLGNAKSKKTREKSKDKNDIGSVDGQIGRFRNGVQVIHNRELKQFKRISMQNKKKQHRR